MLLLKHVISKYNFDQYVDGRCILRHCLVHVSSICLDWGVAEGRGGSFDFGELSLTLLYRLSRNVQVGPCLYLSDSMSYYYHT